MERESTFKLTYATMFNPPEELHERFEAALVEVSPADGTVGDAPAHGVGVGEPAEEAGELGAGTGLDDKVPVVFHEAPGEQGQIDAGPGLQEDAFEGGVVLGLAKKGDAAGGAVEHMVDVTGRSVACMTGHGGMLANVRREY